MFEGTKIEKKVDVEEFLSVIKDYGEDNIECTRHTFFRLSEKQRKIYTSHELRKILTEEKPFLAGLQHNKNYAIFYNYKSRFLKMVLSLDDTNIKIVTFYFIEEWQIPKI